jgi:capsular exopolysaccharide synthesis family protein
MSRIHEALQKAQDGATAASAPTPPAEQTSDPGHETFPIERAEHRLVATAPPPAAPRTAGPTAPASPQPTASVAPAATMTTTVEQPLTFERVDARYAGKIVVDEDISAESREQYRRLAASLHHAQAAAGIKVVMLSSAVMGEGKTLTSSNLALTLSESYHKQVLLIDADLRRPTLHSLFRIRTGAGLSEGLMHPTSGHKIPIHQISNRLAILSAGRPTSNPIAGLTSLRMRQLLDEARGSFDWVIVDTPPVALLPDANLLSAMVDGAVLVVRAESTPWDLVQRAAAAIGQERLLGVVLNGATAEAAAGYYGYDYYSVPQTTPST